NPNAKVPVGFGPRLQRAMVLLAKFFNLVSRADFNRMIEVRQVSLAPIGVHLSVYLFASPAAIGERGVPLGLFMCFQRGLFLQRGPVGLDRRLADIIFGQTVP